MGRTFTTIYSGRHLPLDEKVENITTNNTGYNLLAAEPDRKITKESWRESLERIVGEERGRTEKPRSANENRT